MSDKTKTVLELSRRDRRRLAKGRAIMDAAANRMGISRRKYRRLLARRDTTAVNMFYAAGLKWEIDIDKLRKLLEFILEILAMFGLFL